VGLQKGSYLYSDGSQDDGYRFMCGDASGLKNYPFGHRLPDLSVALELIAQAVAAGWGGQLVGQTANGAIFK
jgi:hypothetical protein